VSQWSHKQVSSPIKQNGLTQNTSGDVKQRCQPLDSRLLVREQHSKKFGTNLDGWTVLRNQLVKVAVALPVGIFFFVAGLVVVLLTPIGARDRVAAVVEEMVVKIRVTAAAAESSSSLLLLRLFLFLAATLLTSPIVNDARSWRFLEILVALVAQKGVVGRT